MIYLDNNATTRPLTEVRVAVERGMAERWENPSSVHRAGQAVRREVELARRSVAELVGGNPKEIVFTSGGTESIDLAIRGVLAALPAEKRVLITTRVEHAAVRDLALELEQAGAARVVWAPIDGDGVVDVAALEGLLAQGAGLVSVQWSNNETGVIQPVERIRAACRARGVLFHCDAVQWVGKEPAPTPPCDLMSFSAHKFHGPKGVGVLWARRGVKLRPRILGTQELGRRGGTENVPGIMGAGVAATGAGAWLARDDERRRLAGLRDRFEALVCAGVPGAVVNAGGVARIWNTTNIGLPRLEAEALLLVLSERGVCASAGAACSSGSLDPSPVLLAMGVPREIAHGSLRFSLSRETTAEEISAAAGVVIESVGRVRGSMPGHA